MQDHGMQKVPASKSPRVQNDGMLALTSAAAAFARMIASCLCLGMIATGAAQAQAPAPVPAVLVQPAALRSLTAQSEFIGRVKALEKVELRARVEGFLGARLFQAGDKVKEGQILFQIERDPFEAAVDQRKAQVASAEATLANATQQLQRAQTLARNQTVSQSTLDDRTADEARGRAALLEARAALRDAEIKLSYTDIKSPIVGTVGRANVSPGNLVGPESDSRPSSGTTPWMCCFP